MIVIISTQPAIDLPVNQIIENLKEFKAEFNETSLNHFTLDKNLRFSFLSLHL